MKESFNDILNNDIITKTKTTFHDFISGIKNLFRHHPANSNDESTASTGGVNSYLKSPEEIEAEFRFFSSQADDNNTETLMVAFNSHSVTIDKTGDDPETGDVEFILPDYMEENY